MTTEQTILSGTIGRPLLLPIRRMMERVEIDKHESDTAGFWALLYLGEMLSKLLVGGLVAGVVDDRERHRYRICHELVRAASLGDWAEALEAVLSGAASQFMDADLNDTQKELTTNVSQGEWQYSVVAGIHQALATMGSTVDPLPRRVAAKQFLPLFVRLRNETRGHGAPSPSALQQATLALASSMNTLATRCGIFHKPWAFLRRNLSGKYRVTPWGDGDERLEYLKREPDHDFADGVYIVLSRPRRVELIDSNAEATDWWFPNGRFSESNYQMLSYHTNDRLQATSEPYLLPVDELPPSSTQGIPNLDVIGGAFTNTPAETAGYVARPILERQLLQQLKLDRHPIVTLTGRGGIGKTSLALRCIHQLLVGDELPFKLVVWFSARDIDSTLAGPKAVRPQGLSIDDFADEYIRLLQPAERESKGFVPRGFLGQDLTQNPFGPTLFVFDNFETVTDLVETFNWIDEFIRPPNKVLLTSRDRRFAGDYPLRIEGMTDDEGAELVFSTANSLGIGNRIDASQTVEIVRESGGHPYVIKLLLGEMAKDERIRSVERIIAPQDRVLDALFERSYARLSPAAQRVFLTLSSWKSSVPRVALEGVLSRPSNERMDVEAAVEELLAASFVEERTADIKGNSDLDVPLVARLFGLKKLRTAANRASIEADSALLYLFGPATQGRGASVDRRILQFFKNAARSIATRKQTLDELLPPLKYVAEQFPIARLLMADLLEDIEGNDSPEIEKALLWYLEDPDETETPSWRVWLRVAGRREAEADSEGALNALALACRAPGVPFTELSAAVNHINRIFAVEGVHMDSDVKEALLTDVIGAFERHRSSFDATDCSRLGWLYFHIFDRQRAEEVARDGLGLDPSNEHCQSLLLRASSNPRSR